jgi:hypothetical protein
MTSKNKALSIAFACALIGASHGSAAAAEDHGAMGHGSAPAPGHEGHGSAAAATVPQGVLLRESKVQGLSFVYRLYSWDERNVMMKGMEGHAMPGMDSSGKATNHLMVFVRDGAGKELTGGKVGFILTGPDKAEQKTLTMGMSGGYGADVTLRVPGTYTIKTKAVIGDRNVVEDFSYTVK